MLKCGRASFVTKTVSVVIIILMMLIALPRFSSGITTFESPISEPSKLQTLDTTAQIESMLLKIDEKLVEKYIQKLQDYKTRYAYRGDKCFQAAEYIHSHFLQNGLEASYSDFTYGGYKMRNIVGQITGTSSPEDIYIICAHYDSTSPLTWTHAPGADDNGSGVADVMAATEILSDYDFNCTIRFIAFGGEELGLKGSSNYVNQVYSLGEKICGVINLDMIAYNPNPGTNEVYLVRDYGDKLAVKKEYVYGPAPAGDTTVQFWLNHTNIIDCTLCIQEQGLPGTYRKMTEGSPGDYTLNRSTGFIDLSTGWGPLAEYENLTAWYNYSASGFLINYTKMVIQKYAHIIDISPVDYQLGSSDHASFAPIYPALMLIEKKYTSNPNYHKITDTLDHLNLTYCANITQAATATLAELAQLDSVDRASPSHGPGFPPNGCYEQSSPCISIEIRDPSPINLTSLQMRVNGTDILPALTGIPLGYNVSYTPPTPYADGVLVNVSIFAEDIHGNGFNHTWEFTVDAIPPQPPTNFSIASSRIELIKRGLVMNIGTTFDSRQARAPSVLFHEGIYKMWYAGQNSSNFHVCYATSPDGISWTKHGIVLYHGIVGELDSNYASYPTVIFDGEYKMWYSGWNGVNVRIMHANSSDGINWIKHGIAVDVGAAGTMDETYAYFPCVIKTNEYKIWYSGFDGLKHRILYANSTDGITWTKHPEDITPLGPGIMHGDGLVWSPEVTYFDGLYHMYYGRYDGSRYRIMHATSPDGLKWSDKGLAIDVGISGNYDFTGADMCSVLVTENETKVWYSGFNGVNWRIMYANITPQDPAKDLTLTWTASTSPDVVRYEVFRESRPSAFKYPLERSFPEFYVPPTGLTPWTFEAESVANVTAYGPKTGSDPSSFYLPDDNILNIDLYLKSDTGDWLELSNGADFSIETNLGFVEITSAQFTTGCTLFAWYNHSAGRALRTTGTSIADVRAGVDANYYYVIRAVDRAGNIAYCAELPGKIQTEFFTSWNLLCNPFLEGPTPIEEALDGLNWTAAKTWIPENAPHQWTSYVLGRIPELNTLHTITPGTGMWVRMEPSSNYTAAGTVSNISINLSPGWNLVSYPYHEIMTVSQALAGVPWDRVEIMDQYSYGFITEISGTDLLYPGHGLWVHVTSSAVWNVVNVP